MGVEKEVVRQQLGKTLDRTDLTGLGEKYEGKVRDNYTSGDKRYIVVTDRISAFDRVLGTIPFKGQLLNKMAKFWFDETKDIVKNHMIASPDPNVMVVKECKPLPVEMVVRGYLTGVTSTSAWTHYSKGSRNFCGNILPDGMKKDQRFSAPILTPSTKAEKGDHDESVSPSELLRRGLVTKEQYDKLAEISLKLFRRGQEVAAKQGIILVDTKYEFGLLDGEIVLIDEIHTPDSSRFWYADTYQELFESGETQRKIDKEYVREWLVSQGFRGDGPVPEIPDEVKVEAARRYIEAYENITGDRFMPDLEDPNTRIYSNLGLEAPTAIQETTSAIAPMAMEVQNEAPSVVETFAPSAPAVLRVPQAPQRPSGPWGGAIAIIGTQYGDEGKGKVVDYLAGEADYVVRFQGGNNAGHTVVVGDKTYKLHLLPSGSVWEKDIVIGNGVVVNPEVLLGEIEGLKKEGLSVNLHLSDRAHIIMPYHELLDAKHDTHQGALTAGSTRRGIGPVHTDKMGRFGVRAVDLLNEDILRKKVSSAFHLADGILTKVYDHPHDLTEESVVQKYLAYGKLLAPYVTDTSELLHSAMESGKNVLLEGAQGVMLCVDWGIYPHTTSSNPLVGGACAGAGIPPTKIKKGIGVVKAYTSRVGHGPLTVELLDELGELIRETGGEYGTTTGRPRRVGWLDAVVLRHAQKLNAFDSVAVTKLDVLTGIKKLKICVAYYIDGRQTNVFPADLGELERAKPIYLEFDGWEEDITKIRDYSQLPLNARIYLETIENLMDVRISLIGVGAERDAVIIKSDV